MCRRKQSVAHMPMKAMIYKTLSTVVDDFFAYVPGSSNLRPAS
jgi:hypothetical protein